MLLNRYLSLTILLLILFIGISLPARAQELVMSTWAMPALPQDDFFVLGNANTVANARIDIAGGNYNDPFSENFETIITLGGTFEIIAPKEMGLDRHDIVFTEIMWGLDRGVATANQINTQWIELYNESGRALAADETFVLLYTPPSEVKFKPLFSDETANYIKAVYPPGITDALTAVVNGDYVKKDEDWTHIVVDRVSNVQRNEFGQITGVFQMPGQSGDTVADAGNNFTTTPLISAQRIDDFGSIKAGHEQGSWEATPAIARRNTASALIQANPGTGRLSPGIPVAGTATAAPAADKLVINEVRNHSNDDLDWIEVKNVQDPAGGATNDIQLDAWELSYTVEEGKEVELVDFPKYKLAPQGILLVVNRDPSETELAGGINLDVMIDTNKEQLQKGATHLYIVRDTLKLPNDGDYLLLLRDNHEKNNDAAKIAEFAKNIQDAAGSKEIDGYAGNRNAETKVWPFQFYDSMGGDKVADFGKTDGNQSAWERKPKGVKAGQYTIDNTNGRHKGAWNKVMGTTTLGMGYDRNVDLRFAPGTPGYENMIANTVDDFVATQPDPDGMEIDANLISISEIMYDAGPRWNLIQWIELYNASMTQAVDITGWELEIRNAKEDVESYVDSVFTFKAAGNPVILPNQTLLIVSGAGTNDVAANRVYNLYEHHRRELGLTTRRSVLLSPTGFYLRLTDRKDLDRDSRDDEDVTVDEAGNVLVDGAQRIIQWDLPAISDGPRQSIVRQYGKRYTPQGGQDAENIRYQPRGGEQANIGNPTAAEVAAAENGADDFWRASDIIGAGISFYGHRDDISTPGYRTGGPLPVSLASFRPVRDKATGEVVIRWITESELNNAGFNILRSETKNGQFKVVNLKGIIPGHGTTSEKHVYAWKDTTAKPNVVYYYQIEDVSLNGKRTTLALTHLRGNVNAAGKLTTTWGDLKTLR